MCEQATRVSLALRLSRDVSRKYEPMGKATMGESDNEPQSTRSVHKNWNEMGITCHNYDEDNPQTSEENHEVELLAQGSMP